MKQLRIYRDTSVISFLFSDDSPDLRRITEDFFENYVRPGVYRVYVSDVAIMEIERTPDPAKRARLISVIREYGLTVLALTDEAIRLGEVYVAQGAVPPVKMDDARHIAIATCNQADVLLSWNFKHLANLHKQFAIRAINEKEGYFYPLTLTSPMEVMHENG
jgi:predicted nucleic acid-binding protein